MSKFFNWNASLALLAISVPAFAAEQYHYADVVSAIPLIRVVEVSTPVEQCREVEVLVEERNRQRSSNMPVLLSTIVGGAIGNAVGHSNTNKKVGVVVGAVLGHSVGRGMLRQQEPTIREIQTVERCETVYQSHEEERIMGYQVTYRYNDQDYSIRTDTDPGDSIKLRVSVQPIL